MQLAQDFVLPNYADGSIANIPATIAHWLGAKFHGLPPLAARFLPGMVAPPKRVVLVVIDGMGWSLLPQLQEELPALFERASVSARLTSIFPSTTVAALSSLWTGLAPAQHGLVGLRLFFPTWGTLGQMLSLSPEFIHEPGALVDAGLQPENFLHGPGIAEQLGGAGITTISFKHNHLVNTALSQMHTRGVAEDLGVYTAADMFVQMRHLLSRQDSRRLFVSAYWSTVDGLMHWHGPSADSVLAEARMLLELFDRELLQPLEAYGRGDTLVCIVADHGQLATPIKKQVYLSDHLDLARMLLMRPAGEPRAPYLYTRHGAAEEAMAYISERLSEQMDAFPTEEVLDGRLLGPTPFAPETRDRLGDLVILMHDGYVLLSDDEPNYLKRMIGRHGGLSADEMYVPWLVFQV